MKKELQTSIKALLRLNRLRIKGKLNKITWQEFFLYKNIVKNNIPQDKLDDNVKRIVNK